jgi:hypothetical protein
VGARDLVFTVLGIDRASKTFNDVGDSVDRMTGRATKALLALSGSSVASSAAVAGALAALPVAFAAVGAAALAQNAEVRDAFGDLGNTLKTGLAQDALPMKTALVDAAQDIGDAYQELRPRIRDLFQESTPAVDALTSGLIGLTRNALPGLGTAVRASEPPVRALESVMKATGRGASEFFVNISHGSDNAARGIESFGDLVEGVLPEVGNALVDLSDMWAEHSDQAVRVIVRLTGVVEDLGGHALPIVSDAMGVALDVLEGALTVIGPLADQLGPLVGIWLSLSFAMRAIGGAQAAITGVTGVIGKFREGVDAASGPNGVGKFSVAARGMLGILGGPWGVALLAAGVALAIFGQRSQDAAAAQRSLATALRESGGEFDASARTSLTNSEAYRKVASSVEKVGLSHKEFIRILSAGGPELDALKHRLEGQERANTNVTVSAGGVAFSENETATAARVLLVSFDQLRGVVTGATEDFRREQEVVDGVSRSMFGGVPGADALAEALATLGKDTATTAEHVDALNTAWRQLFGIQLNLDDAIAAFEGGLDSLRDSLVETKNGVAVFHGEMVSAVGAIDLTTQRGRDLHSSLTDQGESYRALAQAVYDTTLSRTHSEALATQATQKASTQRRDEFAAELRSMGFTAAQVTALTNKYLGLPDQVLTVVKADTSAAQASLDRFITRNDGRTIRVDVQGHQVGQAMRAAGGPIDPGRWYMTGEQGPELVVPRQAGMVLPAAQTRQILAAMQSGGTGSSATFTQVAASNGGASTPVLVQLAPATGAESLFVRWMRTFVKDVGGGSVQRAFGGR